MKVVKPETVGLDATVLKNIREYLDETYVKEGKYVGTITLVSRKGRSGLFRFSWNDGQGK